jgi:single-strand DNA-binding protein
MVKEAESESTGTNVVVLRGVLSRDAISRELPSGDELMSYEVTTRGPGGTSTVPVSAPGTAPQLEAGTEVVVVGQVKRRYFRAGGTTQSRTEVVADAVIPARFAAKSSKAIERAIRLLES